MIMKRQQSHDDEEFTVPVQSKYWETYVKLTKERAIFLAEDFTKESASAIAALLLHYDNEDQDKDITIYIHSNGGDVSALNCIYDVMHMISAPIKTVCIGKSYSCGAALLAAGTKGKRYIMPHAEVMIHKIQVGFPLMNKTQVDHQSYLNFLKIMNDNLMKIISKHTGQSFEKIRDDFFSSSRNLFLDAEGAVAYGLVDHIL